MSEKDGRVLVYCHGRCEQHAVVDALRERGLWNGSTSASAPHSIEGTYDYVDESGELLFQVVRSSGKRFRQRRPDGAGGWTWNLEGTRRVLYRLPAVLAAARQGWRVYVVEGERDADLIALDRPDGLGLAATTPPGGAGKWRVEYADALHGAEIVVIADRDEPGRAHARQVATSCASKAMSVKVIELPGDHVKDASDWISAGGTRDELEALADAAPDWSAAGGRRTASDDAAVVSQLRQLTDLGNAERLAERHAADLRYCEALGGWYVWDGRRWARDETDEVTRRAAESIVALYGEAEHLEDRKAREELVRHAIKSEADGRIAAAIHLARSDARVAIRADAFDGDPWLFTCANGTVDLQTGDLRPHRREDMISRLSPVAFDPEARSDLWESFLDTATGADAELLQYLERAAGYSLTGDTREETLFLVHGPTAAGKSTFIEALKAVAGEYGLTADFETFLSRRDGGPRNDVARLAGRRLVVSIEMDEGRKLAEGLVKTLTGGDTVSARFLFRESFEFRPTAKLWLVANSKPKVSDDDGAMWRRIRLIPFEHTVPEGERDPAVKLQLRDPAIGGAAVLAWAVRGCLDWQQDGLRAPERVRRATDAYREEMDVLADWLGERCEIDPEASAPSRALYADYHAWAKGSGERVPLSSRAFGLRLTARRIEAAKSNGRNVRRGLRLREADE